MKGGFGVVLELGVPQNAGWRDVDAEAVLVGDVAGVDSGFLYIELPLP